MATGSKTSTGEPAVERRTYNQKELAALIGVDPGTLAANRDQLPPAIRLGQQLFWDRQVIENFIRTGGVQ